MDRREFINGSLATVAAALATGLPLSKEARADATSDLKVQDRDTLNKLKVITQTAFACVAAGQACIGHCNEQMIGGEGKEFEHCALAVHQMAAICQAMGTLAAQNYKMAVDLAKVCIDACEECRLACKEHEPHFAHKMHLECQACMLACEACRKACEALL